MKVAAKFKRYLAITLALYVMAFTIAAIYIWIFASPDDSQLGKEIMRRVFTWPAVVSIVVLMILAEMSRPAMAAPAFKQEAALNEPSKPFLAQVVGVRWLNPLAWSDYPTEWNLLWTLGLSKPNKNDYYAKKEPENFSSVKYVADIADNSSGKEVFDGYHEKYVDEMILPPFRDVSALDPKYFYTIAPENKKEWREAAGVHVEYAIPMGKLDLADAGKYVAHKIIQTFDIGNKSFPSTWTRDTPPDVHVTAGGTNVGFTSLEAALDYLKANPKEAVWVMNWDAPHFPKQDISENMVLLILVGPQYKFDAPRDPLAWIGYPASRSVVDFDSKKGEPPRAVQAWEATMAAAAANAGKVDTDIGYVIHDAGTAYAEASDRLGSLAQSLTTELPEFDFLKQTFNTASVLGDMGAGSALTNVALGIAYANHLGKNVLVAGTTDAQHPTAVMVVQPPKARPVNPDKDWYRARGRNTAYLMWWGLRNDDHGFMQGYSR